MIMTTHDHLHNLINSILGDNELSLDQRFDIMTDVVEPLITTAFELGITTIKPIYELTADDLI